MSAQESLPIAKLIDSIIPPLLESHDVPGIAISLFDEGDLVYSEGHGWAQIAEEEEVTTQSLFNIGSISKMVTAIVIMNMVEEGQLDLDAPVETYLSRWNLPPSTFDHKKITIRALLSHTAGISVHGFPGFPLSMDLPALEQVLNGENGPSRENALVEVVLEPQSQFKYSGGGYTILQLVIEEVTGQQFEKYVQAVLFDRLGMKHSSFIINKNELGKYAQPYNEHMEPVPHEHFAAQAAAGLNTNMKDLSILMDDILNHHQILSLETFDEMLLPVSVTNGKYGLGIRVLNLGSLSLKGHAGSNTGWQSAIFMDFDSGSGLIMMTNGENGKKMMQSILRTWGMYKFSPQGY